MVEYLDKIGLAYLWGKIKSYVSKTATLADGKFIYNGQSVPAKIAGTVVTTSGNPLGDGVYVLLRADSSNPLLGLFQGGIKWYAQALNGMFYFGPTSTKALRLDPNGNGVFQSGSVTAKSIIKSGGTAAQFLKADGSVDSNAYITDADLPTAITGEEMDSVLEEETEEETQE